MAKVLVVDDSKLQRKRIGSDIEELQYETVYACNGEEALSCIEKHQPDCIVTDLLMPVMDGVEFLKRLQVNKSEIPVIVLTANSNQKKIDEVKKLGIHLLINKPHDCQKLQKAVKEILNAS